MFDFFISTFIFYHYCSQQWILPTPTSHLQQPELPPTDLQQPSLPTPAGWGNARDQRLWFHVQRGSAPDQVLTSLNTPRKYRINTGALAATKCIYLFEYIIFLTIHVCSSMNTIYRHFLW